MSKELEQTKNLNFNTLAGSKVEDKEMNPLFNFKYDDYLHILFYQTLNDKGTTKAKEIKWSEWCEFLTKPKVSQLNKYANGLAIYGDVEDGVDERTGEIIEHRRLKEHVLWRQVFSFDYDDIDDLQRFVSNIKSRLRHFAYFAYSTYRHRDVKDKNNDQLRPRFRVLIPVDDILKPDEYTKFGAALNRFIGENIDETSLNPIQLSALPTVLNNDVPFHWFHNDAPFIKYTDLEKCYSMYPQNNVESISKDSKSYQKKDTSHWSNIAFGVGEGERNVSLASITGHLLQKGVDLNLVRGLIMAWGETCTPPINRKEVKKTFNSIMRKHLTNDNRKEGV